MSPADYAGTIVLPTVREFLAHRSDRRRAYLACIVTAQLVDWIARAEGGDQGQAKTAVLAAIGAICRPSLDVVRGIATGAKHAGPGRGHAFTPGTERDVPAMAWGHTAWGHSRWGVPGLQIEREGARLFVDWAVQAVLKTFLEVYPQHLGGVDLDGLDPAFRGAPLAAVEPR